MVEGLYNSFDVLKTEIGSTSLNLFWILTNPNIDTSMDTSLNIYIDSLKSFNKYC